MNTMNILLVDDEPEALRSMELTLRMAGFSGVHCCSRSTEAAAYLVTAPVDIAVLDIMMPELGGIELLKKIKEKDPDSQVIMATGVQEIGTAVWCMREGALDYLLKPLDSERFVAGIRNAVNIRELQYENTNLTQQLLSPDVNNPEVFAESVTRSEVMIKIFKYIEAIAPTRHPVLVTGETGVGKEQIARAIHTLSGLPGKFVAINVAGIDDTVFSDTLFGHVKGAFTGADSCRKGLVESAAGGTLFLDEIGDLSMQSQTKLLRLLQEKEFLPLGTDTPAMSDARIVTATCRDLVSIDKSESFRKDLYYRLRTHHIAVPPLRSRKGDIELLVPHFARRAAAELSRTPPAIPRELFTLLNLYHFPGNIRELQAMVFDAISMQKGNTLSLQSFKEKIGGAGTDSTSVSQNAGPPDDGIKRLIFPEQLPTLREIEDLLVDEALRRTGGNQSIASQVLGITRQALGKRLKNRNTP
jgi:DNA-binding NtrC family response regulator